MTICPRRRRFQPFRLASGLPAVRPWPDRTGSSVRLRVVLCGPALLFRIGDRGAVDLVVPVVSRGLESLCCSVSLASMKVVLPDSSELELSDGASGLDAARAIGPKLAEQAILLRSNGHVQDLRLPLEDGQQIQILTTRDTLDPDALYVLRHSPRTCLPKPCADSIPARRSRSGRRSRTASTTTSSSRSQSARTRSSGSRRRSAGSWKRAALGAPGGLRRGGEALLRRAGGAVQGRAGRYRRRADLVLHARRLHRPLPRAAPCRTRALSRR